MFLLLLLLMLLINRNRIHHGFDVNLSMLQQLMQKIQRRSMQAAYSGPQKRIINCSPFALCLRWAEVCCVCTMSVIGCFSFADNVDLFLQDSEGATEAPPPTAKTGKPSQKAAGKAAAGAAASKADKAAERQRQAQLELLMMDDSALQDVARLGKYSFRPNATHSCHTLDITSKMI